MGAAAPNLAALIGDSVGARFISKAGSLTNLSKLPASTIQILGAEKALFCALKSKSNTPKCKRAYLPLAVHREGHPKAKGRISRFLANKCSLASQIDNFSDVPTTKFGEAFKQQVNDRIEFYATDATGVSLLKNSAVMASVLVDLAKSSTTGKRKANRSHGEGKDKKQKIA